ncbi:MAG: hypothetical protein BWY02_02016 [bacterium ADurb.Bin157]|nr:MAG: hypothetical protein BWY02_02016 [bacterium ADurb.Bin157]
MAKVSVLPPSLAGCYGLRSNIRFCKPFSGARLTFWVPNICWVQQGAGFQRGLFSGHVWICYRKLGVNRRKQQGAAGRRLSAAIFTGHVWICYRKLGDKRRTIAGCNRAPAFSGDYLPGVWGMCYRKLGDKRRRITGCSRAPAFSGD